MTEMFLKILSLNVEDRLTAKSLNQENLLEGTSVACQIIGFEHHNSAQTLVDAYGGQGTLPLRALILSSRKNIILSRSVSSCAGERHEVYELCWQQW